MEERGSLIVPRDVEHRPVEGEEVSVLLFEPKSTYYRRNVRTEISVENLTGI